ncbi:hypothetical protein C8Q80DRAFT_1149022 [Daedaleopsis nitida]|nr:hypothetical protein C8Q80DRAFT_1149022 [Daedaleopsis nitida]
MSYSCSCISFILHDSDNVVDCVGLLLSSGFCLPCQPILTQARASGVITLSSTACASCSRSGFYLHCQPFLTQARASGVMTASSTAWA